MIAIALFMASATAVSAQTMKKIDSGKSKINWVGKKVTGAHDGFVKISEGYLNFDGKELTSGSIIVDMNSITVTDLQPGKGKEKLEGHLKNDDFFATDKYPTANLSWKNAKSKGNGTYTINGFLNIKGQTQPITLDLIMNGNTGTANFLVDRTKYDIKYGSGSFFDNLGDRAIDDNFEVKANIVLQ